VWEGGANSKKKTNTAEFLSGLVGVLTPLHELTKNVVIKLPEYLGQNVAGTEQPVAPHDNAIVEEPPMQQDLSQEN